MCSADVAQIATGCPFPCESERLRASAMPRTSESFGIAVYSASTCSHHETLPVQRLWRSAAVARMGAIVGSKVLLAGLAVCTVGLGNWIIGCTMSQVIEGYPVILDESASG